MVVIRLARGGAKKNPYYRLMVADQRHKATGRFIEQVGFYNPTAKGSEEVLRLDTARIDHWVAQGAQMSPRVQKLVKDAK
ncbi:30S ribosomal protein S16 [Hydrogenovibrio kuenenii]|uniref:30S ribosomal protein S16 n=1 Tax=Hydrogenovibrio kuenenii TaxID=63658 RepID=UPI000467A318|nr:30S ribosomal protein S16 [Hydrogenovibrio kuenenii]